MIDLTNKKFGRLTVIKKNGQYVSPNNLKEPLWLCKCECGREINVRGSQLRSQNTKSCGCLSRDNFKKMITKHGFGDKENLYKHWLNIRNRCNNPKSQKYHIYGGRGIKVCNEWNNYEKFREWSLNNNYKLGLTLDRINNNGNYEPSNCRWVSWKVQQNNRRNNHYITYNGQTLTMMEWSELLNINYSTLRNRVNQYHWEIGRALGYE